MITTAALIAINVTLGKSTIPLLLAAAIDAVSAERMRQFELAREMGTIACEIENYRMLGRPCTALEARHAELARLRRKV